MEKQLSPSVKGHLIQGAFYVLLLLAACVIPLALAEPVTTDGNAAKQDQAGQSAHAFAVAAPATPRPRPTPRTAPTRRPEPTPRVQQKPQPAGIVRFAFSVEVQDKKLTGGLMRPAVSSDAPDFVRNVLGPIIQGHGDQLPVSAMPIDGTFPTGTARFEKRSLAREIPVWNPEICIQCSRCAIVMANRASR